MTPHEPKNPRVVLLEDHHRIDQQLDRLRAAVHADDREASAKAWARIEKALLAHFDVEEMFVLPALADEHAAEVDRIRRDHALLRRTIGEMGLAFELHAVRAEAIDAFCDALREHAEREESLLYARAERKLTVNVVRAIVDRIRGGAGRRARKTNGAREARIR